MPPATLFRYITTQMILAVLVMFVVLTSLVIFVDLVESLRFVDKHQGGDLWFAVSLSLLRTPSVIQTMLPFVFLFGAIWLFHELNRRAELAVMRSAGLSVWRLLAPAALVAVLVGALVITVADPLSTHFLSQSEKMRDKLTGGTSSVVRIFGDGIWLRQRDANHVLLINAKSYDVARAALSHVVVWRLDENAAFVERIDAPEAVLSGRTIELKQARIKGAADRLDRRSPIYAVATELTPADLGERVESPETLSLWRLPKFIALAEVAGLPTTRYSIRLHDLCSTPLKLVAMVLIAAMFSLRPVRSGAVIQLFLLAVVAGFLLYMLSEISTALGESGTAPVTLAAWAPAVIATLAAVTGLLHLEEG
ncbi:MAG: LPS export ABC transporter permease LptG [Amphiplicatus sp.]